MIPMPSFGLLFLMSMLIGGVGDLLDVVPTDEYWRIKNVRVTEDLIRQELAAAPAAGDISALVDALGGDDAAGREAAAEQIRGRGPGVVSQLREAAKSDNPEVAARARRLIGEVQGGGDKAQQVRRLMAVRTAGERKMAGLLPRLEELAAADGDQAGGGGGGGEPFVADYAAAAVAAIEGKPHARPRPADVAADVWRLPADCRAVLHVATGGKPATAADLDAVLQAMPDPQDAGQKQRAADRVIRQLVGVAEQIGNVRVDGVTVGVAGDIGPRAGYVAFVARGRYDPAAVAAMLGRLGAGQGRAVNGVDAIEFGKTSIALFPSNTHAVLVAGPKDAAKPIEALALAFRGGNGGPAPLKGAAEMANLLAAVDTTQPMWGAVHVTGNYRQVPPLEALEWLTLVGRPKGKGVSFRLDAKGQNGEGMGRTVGMVTQGVGQAKAELRQNAEQVPPQFRQMLTVVLKLVESIEVRQDERDPTRAALTGNLDAPPLSLVGTIMGGFGVQSTEVVPAPQPVPVPQP